MGGQGATPLDAAKKCRKQSPYGKQTGKITFYECHPETTVNGLGDFIYPTGQAPQKIIA